MHGRALVDAPFEFRVPRYEQVDLGAVDAVLLTSEHGVLGLPFVTEGSGFAGTVCVHAAGAACAPPAWLTLSSYATRPAIEFGRQMAEALVQQVGRGSQPSAVGSAWKTAAACRALGVDAGDAARWRGMYDAGAVARAVARCVGVAYGEKITPLGDVVLEALPSGCSIGGALWIVGTVERRLLCAGPAAKAPRRAHRQAPQVCGAEQQGAPAPSHAARAREVW